LKLLLLIQRGANHFEDVWDSWEAMPFRGKVVWPKGIRKEMFKVRQARERARCAREQKIAYSKIIYQLKRDGLVEDKNKFLKLTNVGLAKIGQLSKLVLHRDLPLVSTYKKQPAPSLKIISYDVPEKFRKKRDWLRSALKFLGFQMAHQSMWYGKMILPKNFVEDLERLELLPFVKIFSVNKSGSLKALS